MPLKPQSSTLFVGCAQRYTDAPRNTVRAQPPVKFAASVRLPYIGLVPTLVKDERLDLRLTRAQKSAIEAASTALGRSLTEFTVESAVERAHDVLADQREFHTLPGGWEELVKLLDSPVTPNAGLARLFAKPSVFAAA
jgi:uncharacterized protein (DUF1778 family)